MPAHSISQCKMGQITMADIHSFESLGALDGQGLRFCVFFTGCPLRCAYCHNPDTWHKSGREMSPRELFDKIRRFKPYFKNGGGVTFSGGEPLLNAETINELRGMLESEGIGYCLDTSGSVPLTDEVKAAIDGADMVLLDLKFPTEELYKKYTGGSLETVLQTGKYCSEKGIRLILRTVIVPGINDSREMIDSYAETAGSLKFEDYELLGFHTMGFFKYENLNMANPLKDTPPMDPKKLRELQEYLSSKISGEKQQ